MSSPVFTEYQGRRFVCFSSPHSDNGWLSNWHDAHFSLDSRDFVSSEQAFLYLKATTSGDEATALRVFAMSDPSYFARLSKQIRPFDVRSWLGRRESVMRQCVRTKFEQDEEAREFLLSTGDATIVCCSRNPLWGCGYDISQIERLEPDEWPGQNLLGSILSDIREELRPPEPAAEPAPQPAPEAASAPDPEPTTAVEAEPAPAAKAEPAPVGEREPEAPEATGTEPTTASDEDATTLMELPKADDEASDLSLTQPLPQPPAEPAPELAGQEPAAENAPATDVTSELPPMDERSATTVTAPVGSARGGDGKATGESDPATGESPATPHGATAPTDPVVRRYAQGQAPTARELADGSILKHLMRTFTQGDSAEVRQALMQCLRDSTVTVPASKVDPVIAATIPVRDDAPSDPLVMDEGETYRPSILENDSGERWFPAFSSDEEVDSQVARQMRLLRLPMSQCIELARTRGGLSGVVVNVFTENLILPGRTCDYIAGLPASEG